MCKSEICKKRRHLQISVLQPTLFKLCKFDYLSTGRTFICVVSSEPEDEKREAFQRHRSREDPGKAGSALYSDGGRRCKRWEAEECGQSLPVHGGEGVLPACM